MKKLYFIYNPYSGRSANRKNTINSKLFNIIDCWVKAGYDVTVRPTQCQGDAYENVKLACNSNMYDLIVCSGGDGTFNEAVHGIVSSNSSLPIGYIPTGSTNDFARSVSIPKGIEKSALSVVDGKEMLIDYGLFNHKNVFTYVCAFGAFTDVTYETPQEAKNYMGHTAYVMEAIKHLGDIKNYHIRFKHDGIEHSGEYIVGMIVNSNSVGGIFSFKDFYMNDGVFDVLLLKKPDNLIQLQNAVTELINFKSNKVHAECIEHFKTSKLIIDSDEFIKWNLDGEFGGEITHAEIENVHLGLKIITKPSKRNNYLLSIE